MNSFCIKSLNSSAQIEFSNLSGDHFDVQIKSHGLQVIRRVYDGLDWGGLPNFFDKMAQATKPWPGEHFWASIELEVRLTATCDATGHIALSIEVLNDYVKDKWSAKLTIGSELGEMVAIAKSAKHFFDKA